MTDQTKPLTIGLFDSGVGGLSVVRQLARLSRNREALRLVYVADTARCPYGDRAAGEIRDFVRQITGFLNECQVESTIMACNTSAAVAAADAAGSSPVPVYNLIDALARQVAARYQRVGVMATSSTVRTGAFSRAISQYSPDCRFIEVACPNLVPLIEQGILSGPLVQEALVPYAWQMKMARVDVVILGCTHFPFLASDLAQLLPDSIEIIDPAMALATQLELELGLEPAAPAQSPQCTYFVTGELDRFVTAARLCLGSAAKQLLDGAEFCHLPLSELVPDTLELVPELPPAIKSTLLGLTPQEVAPQP